MTSIPAQTICIEGKDYLFVGDSLGKFPTKSQALIYKDFLSDKMRGKYALLKTGEFVDVDIIISEQINSDKKIEYLLYWRRIQ